MNEQDHPKPAAPADSGGLAGSKLTTVFAIVLAAHLVIIIVALSWYFLSGRTSDSVVDQATTPAATPSVAGSREPRLETDPAPLISSEVLDTMNTAAMPGSTDPVWGAAPAPLPDADPFADIEPAPAAPAGYTVAPLPPLAPMPQTVPAPVAVPAETAAALGRSGAPAQAPATAAAKPTAPASAKTTGTTTYRVVHGDTLTRIAQRHGTTVAEIKRLNGLSSDALRINQVLNIAGPKAAPARTPAAATTAREWTGTHTVAAGETLYRISRTYQTTPAALAKANNITDPAKVRVGTVLRVPGSSTAKAAPKPAKPAPSREARVTPPAAPAPAPVLAPAPTPAKPAPQKEAKAAPDLKPFRPPVLTQEMVMMNM